MNKEQIIEAFKNSNYYIENIKEKYTFYSFNDLTTNTNNKKFFLPINLYVIYYNTSQYWEDYTGLKLIIEQFNIYHELIFFNSTIQIPNENYLLNPNFIKIPEITFNRIDDIQHYNNATSLLPQCSLLGSYYEIFVK